MESYNIELLCVSEAHWIDSGKRILSTGHSILYSGQTDHQHRGGVAIIMNRKVEKSLLDWKPISDRLIKAKFATKLTVITCYAPTEDAEIKDGFYEVLFQKYHSNTIEWYLGVLWPRVCEWYLNGILIFCIHCTVQWYFKLLRMVYNGIQWYTTSCFCKGNENITAD